MTREEKVAQETEQDRLIEEAKWCVDNADHCSIWELKFIGSVSTQASQGKILSEKQLVILRTLKQKVIERMTS